jgi:hypothetical protein
MSSILERLKLVDHLTTEIEIDRKAFVENLQDSVDRGNAGFFASPFEVFSSSTNQYRGIVTFDSFKLRRRRRFFDMMQSRIAVAEGRFIQRENMLVVEATIKSFGGVFLIVMLTFYVFLIGSMAFSDSTGNTDWVFIPFIFIHALFMLGIPVLIMRRAVSRMKYDLERDLYFLSKERGT